MLVAKVVDLLLELDCRLRVLSAKSSHLLLMLSLTCPSSCQLAAEAVALLQRRLMLGTVLGLGAVELALQVITLALQPIALVLSSVEIKAKVVALLLRGCQLIMRASLVALDLLLQSLNMLLVLIRVGLRITQLRVLIWSCSAAC